MAYVQLIISDYEDGKINNSDMFVLAMKYKCFEVLKYVEDKRVYEWLSYLCINESAELIKLFIKEFANSVSLTSELNLYMNRNNESPDYDLIMMMIDMGWYTDMDINSYCMQNVMKNDRLSAFYVKVSEHINVSSIYGLIVNNHPLYLLEKVLEVAQFDKVHINQSLLDKHNKSFMKHHPKIVCSDIAAFNDDPFWRELKCYSINEQLNVVKFMFTKDDGSFIDVAKYLPHHFIINKGSIVFSVKSFLCTEEVDASQRYLNPELTGVDYVVPLFDDECSNTASIIVYTNESYSVIYHESGSVHHFESLSNDAVQVGR